LLPANAERILRVEKRLGLVAARRDADGAKRRPAKTFQVERPASVHAEAAFREQAGVDVDAWTGVNLLA
jgi:hypothetical protein